MEMTNDEAREYFAKSGLTYNDMYDNIRLLGSIEVKTADYAYNGYKYLIKQ